MTDTEPPVTSLPSTQVVKSDGKSANVSLGQLMRQLSAADQASQGAENSPASAPAAVEATPASPASTETTPVVAAETTVEAPLIAPPEEPAAEPVADEALSHETTLTPELQAVIDKRIGKEVAKRKSMEAELAQLREKVGHPAAPVAPPSNLPPVVIAPTPEQPLANIQNYDALKKVESDTRQIKYLAQEGLDTIDATGQEAFVINDKPYTKAELKNVVRNASRSLEETIPQRQTFLSQRLQSVGRALEMNPELGKIGSEAHTAALAILRDPKNADLHYRADSLERIALMIEGQKAFSARAKPAAQSKPKPAVSSKAPASQVAFGAAATGSSRAAASTQADGALADEMKKLSAKGGLTTRDVARFLSRKEQLTSNRS